MSVDNPRLRAMKQIRITEWGTEAALARLDAADPLLPKVRALVEAVALYEAVAPMDTVLAVEVLSQFTSDDLARLGVTEQATS